MPLLNYTPLTHPVLIGGVRALEPELRKAQAELEAQYPDGRLYFPFGFSDKRELRAQQTYFVKMPREVPEVLGLDDLEHAVVAKLPTPPGDKGQPKGKSRKRGDSGYIADSAVRSAIEWRAMNLAVEKGADKRRVEVKGSSGAAATVELTHSEVDNSRMTVLTDLFVVDGIQWWREAAPAVKAQRLGHIPLRGPG